MDVWLYIWIALMGTIPPAVCSFIIGYLLYWYGRRQGEKQYVMAKKEIRAYVKGELIEDITIAIRQQINGLFGPVGRGATAEARAEAAQFIRDNPERGGLLMSVASKAAAKWLGKQLGVSREVSEMLGGVAPNVPIFSTHRKPKEDLARVHYPGENL